MDAPPAPPQAFLFSPELTHPYCSPIPPFPFCDLQSLGVNAYVVELDTMDDGSAIQAALAQITGQRTVPNVFVKGKHIGGCDDTVAAQKAGTLGL